MVENSFQLAVIGAGASGLTAAARAAQDGKSVVILDHRADPGAKVLISGGGRCNFTNKKITADFYFSENPHFCKSALARFGTQDILDRFSKAGIEWKEEENGKIFAGSAAAVRDFLFRNAAQSGALFRFAERIEEIEKNEALFSLKTDQGRLYAEAVLIATGGLSCPALGASDFGFRAARRFGLKIIEPAPALVPFRFDAAGCPDLRDLSGVSVPVSVTVGRKKITDNLLLTHKGVSGPAALRASLYWEPGMAVQIDFLPGENLRRGLEILKEQKEKRFAVNVLAEKMPLRLAQRFSLLLPENRRNIPLAQLSGRDLAVLAEGISHCSFRPAGTDGYDKAEVTKGGVDTGGLSSSTMEARTVKGLYFAGEVMDVTGELGGYNLHWAWASGEAAGHSV